MEVAIIQRIKGLISEKNLNMSQFANRIDCEQKTVNNYLNGKRKLSLGFVESIIITFKLDANWLLFGTENGKEGNEIGIIEVDYKEKWIELLQENIELHRNLAEFYKETKILENENGGAVANVRAAKVG